MVGKLFGDSNKKFLNLFLILKAATRFEELKILQHMFDNRADGVHAKSSEAIRKSKKFSHVK